MQDISPISFTNDLFILINIEHTPIVVEFIKIIYELKGKVRTVKINFEEEIAEMNSDKWSVSSDTRSRLAGISFLNQKNNHINLKSLKTTHNLLKSFNLS